MKVKCISSVSMGENCYILTDEKSGESAVIDPGEYGNELENYLNDEKIRVKYILITHGHFDHIMGITHVKNKFGGLVCVHRLDSECLSDGGKCLASYFGLPMKIKEKADIILEDGSELFLGDCKIEVMHTPGHSAGSVTFKTDDYLFTGDTIFYTSYGRTDFEGGNFDDLFKSAIRIFGIDKDMTVYPGHGEKTTLSFERKYNPLMRG